MQDFKRGTVRANQLTFEYLAEGDRSAPASLEAAMSANRL